MSKQRSRTNEIVKVSFQGIGANLLLVAGKAVVGFAANSTSVLLDAVNNLSDALSSVITIIGTKLAGKAADREHPFGHGRIEYVTSSLIAILVLLAGITSLKESVTLFFHPEETGYTAVSLLLIAAGVAVKLFLGRYFQRKGRALNSGALTASGTDALFDAVLSFSTLICAALNLLLHINLEAVVGTLISLFILKAGAEIILETMQHIIGIRADADLSRQVREILCAHPDVHGAYDLILHSYGPEKYFGSVHLELDDHMTVQQLDALTRTLVPEVFEACGVLLTIGVYARNNSTEETETIRKAVEALTAADEQILQMHGFYADLNQKLVFFDLVFAFRTDGVPARTDAIRQKLAEQFPGYQFYINIDSDFID